MSPPFVLNDWLLFHLIYKELDDFILLRHIMYIVLFIKQGRNLLYSQLR